MGEADRRQRHDACAFGSSYHAAFREIYRGVLLLFWGSDSAAAEFRCSPILDESITTLLDTSVLIRPGRYPIRASRLGIAQSYLGR